MEIGIWKVSGELSGESMKLEILSLLCLILKDNNCLFPIAITFTTKTKRKNIQLKLLIEAQSGCTWLIFGGAFDCLLKMKMFIFLVLINKTNQHYHIQHAN